MISGDRFGFTPAPQAEARVEHGQEKRLEIYLDTATQWAHTLGRLLGATRQWVESESIGNRPLTTLGVAFGLGVLTGWLVKRR